MTAPNTISLDCHFEHDEALTASAISPGHLVETINASGVRKVQKHGTAKGFGQRAFAVEDALQGKTIDDAYASGDIVSFHIQAPGSKVYAYLKAGTNYTIGTKLESAGDGTLQALSGSADLQCFAVVEEALDLSASGAVAARAVVKIL